MIDEAKIVGGKSLTAGISIKFIIGNFGNIPTECPNTTQSVDITRIPCKQSITSDDFDFSYDNNCFPLV